MTHHERASPQRPRGLRWFLLVLALAVTSLLTFIAALGADQFAERFLPKQIFDHLDGLLQAGESPVAVAEVSSPPAPSRAAPAAPLPVPDDLRLIMMIRAALIALNQANLTGNYAVFHALAAPGFQQANSVEKLAEIFASLRNHKVDLTPLLVLQPKLVRKPVLSDEGMLRLTGFIPSLPEQINFDLLFEPAANNQWLVYGISVTVAPPQQAAAPAQPVPAPAARTTRKPPSRRPVA